MAKMTKQEMKSPASVEWVGDWDGSLRLLDQTLLPGSVEFVDCKRPEQAFEAIQMLRVRGHRQLGLRQRIRCFSGYRNFPTATPN